MAKISAGQIISLRNALREVSGMVDDAHVYIINGLLQSRDVQSLDKLERHEWQWLRNRLYPNWSQEDWSLSPEWKTKIAGLLADYRENVTGQMRLL